jgi:signal peptidase I
MQTRGNAARAWGVLGPLRFTFGPRHVRRVRGEVLSVVLQGLMVMGLLGGSFALCRAYVLQSICVQGSSMVPTLRERQWYLASPLLVRWQGVRRGDIVVLRDPTDGGLVVKRVVGVAGDTVELRGGRVYLNGRLLDESYLPEGTRTDPVRGQWARVTCGPGEVYVLGDNRGVSADSREYGPVRSEAVLGRVLW